MKSRLKTYQSFNLANRLVPCSQITNTTTQCVETVKNQAPRYSESSGNSHPINIVHRNSLPYLVYNNTQNELISNNKSTNVNEHQRLQKNQITDNISLRNQKTSRQKCNENKYINNNNRSEHNSNTIGNINSSETSTSNILNNLTARTQINYIKPKTIPNQKYINISGIWESSFQEQQQNKKTNIINNVNNISNTNNMNTTNNTVINSKEQQQRQKYSQNNEKQIKTNNNKINQYNSSINQNSCITNNDIINNKNNFTSNMSRKFVQHLEDNKNLTMEQNRRQANVGMNSSYIYIKPNNRYNTTNINTSNQIQSINKIYKTNNQTLNNNSTMNSNISSSYLNKNNNYIYSGGLIKISSPTANNNSNIVPNTQIIESITNMNSNNSKLNEYKQPAISNQKMQINIRKNSSKILVYPQSTTHTTNINNTTIINNTSTNNLSTITNANKTTNTINNGINNGIQFQNYINVKNKSKNKNKNFSKQKKYMMNMQNQNQLAHERQINLNIIQGINNSSSPFYHTKKQLQQSKNNINNSLNIANNNKTLITAQQLNLLGDLSTKNQVLTMKIQSLEGELQILKIRLRQLSETEHRYKQEIQNKNNQIQKIKKQNRLQLKQIRVMALKQQKQHEKQTFIKIKEHQQLDLLRNAVKEYKEKQIRHMYEIDNIKQFYQRKIQQINNELNKRQSLQITQKLNYQYKQIQQKFGKVQVTYNNLNHNFNSLKKQRQQLSNKYQDMSQKYSKLQQQKQSIQLILKQNRQKQISLMALNADMVNKIQSKDRDLNKLLEQYHFIQQILNNRQLQINACTQQINTLKQKQKQNIQAVKLFQQSILQLQFNMQQKQRIFQNKTFALQQKFISLYNKLITEVIKNNTKNKMYFSQQLGKIAHILETRYKQIFTIIGDKNHQSIQQLAPHSNQTIIKKSDYKKLVNNIIFLINNICNLSFQNISQNNNSNIQQINGTPSKQNHLKKHSKHHRHSSNNLLNTSVKNIQIVQQQTEKENKKYEFLQNEHFKLAQSFKKCQQEYQKIYRNFCYANQVIINYQKQLSTKAKEYQQNTKTYTQNMERLNSSHQDLVEKLISLKAKMLNDKYKNLIEEGQINNNNYINLTCKKEQTNY